MPRPRFAFAVLLALVAARAQAPNPATGEPAVRVSQSGAQWTLAGARNTVTLTAAALAMPVRAANASWRFLPSTASDLLLSLDGDEFSAALTSARDIRITPYRTGYKTGVKLVFEGFRSTG